MHNKQRVVLNLNCKEIRDSGASLTKKRSIKNGIYNLLLR